MKSQQETTSLGQIATVTAKPKNKGRAFINTDMRRFKIQTGDMDPPPPPLARPHGHGQKLEKGFNAMRTQIPEKVIMVSVPW